MNGETDPGRKVLKLTGTDRVKFLQGLVTNDIGNSAGGLVYSALLSPQGKYLADFFVTAAEDALLIDVDARLAAGLAQRLGMYRLRADVQIEETPLFVHRGLGPAPDGCWPDPRHPALGWRGYFDHPAGAPQIDWDALRVAYLVPQSLVELQPNESYVLEMNFEALQGVDFRKGCYVGQEVTARMKHKTELRKGLARLLVEGTVAPGTPIMSGDREIGTVTTVSDGEALGYIRFDRAAGGEMTAAGHKIRLA